MIWSGINRKLTSTYQGTGVSEYQQNTRMTVEGELQRRPGMAPANFSPAGGSALGMVGAFPTSGPYGCVVDSAGTINGFPVTGPRWGWPQVQPPVAQGSQWVIGNSLWGSDGTATATGTCPGSANIRTDITFSGTVTVFRQSLDFSVTVVYDSRAIVGLTNYTIDIPWSLDLPQVGITHVGGPGAHTAVSTPGCG